MEAKFSRFFSLNELSYTNPEIEKRYGIRNTPGPEEVKNLQRLAQKVLDPLREAIGKPLKITSGYRNAKYNKIINGSDGSQHILGQAADIDGDLTNVPNSKIFNYIKNNLEFDQIIWEFGNDKNPDWVHVSYADKNRKKVTKAIRENGKVKYIPF